MRLRRTARLLKIRVQLFSNCSRNWSLQKSEPIVQIGKMSRSMNFQPKLLNFLKWLLGGTWCLQFFDVEFRSVEIKLSFLFFQEACWFVILVWKQQLRGLLKHPKYSVSEWLQNSHLKASSLEINFYENFFVNHCGRIYSFSDSDNVFDDIRQNWFEFDHDWFDNNHRMI